MDYNSEDLLIDKMYPTGIYARQRWTDICFFTWIKSYKDAHFWVVKVCGTIYNFEIKNYSLIPYGSDDLLTVVKVGILKAIGKEKGDTVPLILYNDTVWIWNIQRI